MLVLVVEYIFLTNFFGVYFNHQSQITIYNFFKLLQAHGDLLWVAFMYCLYTQLLIFIEKFLPLSGFEPGNSPVPSGYATKWAILAWITIKFTLDVNLTHRKSNHLEDRQSWKRKKVYLRGAIF